jgi:SAM-dependent methyltransferase
MSEIVTGEAYVKAITALESDRRARSAFQTLVQRIAKPGAALYDFGAGPGLDARFYAECGFTVAAYDVDPAMRDSFTLHCRKFIETGQVMLDGGSYREFLAGNSVAGKGSIDLVTTNFAPLNLVEDLHELFVKFHALTGPNGQVLASVISPYWIRDLKCGWWWRNTLRLWRDGYYYMPGATGHTTRRRLANYATQSAPYFSLERVYPGMPADNTGSVNGADLSRGDRYTWLRLTRCQFMFLLFRKQLHAS